MLIFAVNEAAAEAPIDVPAVVVPQRGVIVNVPGEDEAVDIKPSASKRYP